MILGFSQGACLASEFVGRTPRRYGGFVVLSGALIGEAIDPDDYEDDLRTRPCSSAVAMWIHISLKNEFLRQPISLDRWTLI